MRPASTKNVFMQCILDAGLRKFVKVKMRRIPEIVFPAWSEASFKEKNICIQSRPRSSLCIIAVQH